MLCGDMKIQEWKEEDLRKRKNKGRGGDRKAGREKRREGDKESMREGRKDGKGGKIKQPAKQN